MINNLTTANVLLVNQRIPKNLCCRMNVLVLRFITINVNTAICDVFIFKWQKKFFQIGLVISVWLWGEPTSFTYRPNVFSNRQRFIAKFRISIDVCQSLQCTLHFLTNEHSLALHLGLHSAKWKSVRWVHVVECHSQQLLSHVTTEHNNQIWTRAYL